MKKTVYIILLSFFSILFLISCAEKKVEKKEKDKKEKTTIEVETEEETTVPVITVENLTTTTKPIQTKAQAKKLNLNNKMEGPYSFKSIEFSLPAYLDTKKEETDTIKLSGDVGNIMIFASENCAEDTYDEVLSTYEEKMEEMLHDYYDELEKLSSESTYILDKKVEYKIYSAKVNNRDIKLYKTLYYDKKTEILYAIDFSVYDTNEYDFESDFVNILKSIKLTDYTPEKNDMLQINRTFISTDRRENTVLVVEYTWTNTTDKSTSFIWEVRNKCFQNGIECSRTYLCDDVNSGEQTREVMPGYSLTVREAFVIKDMSDVTLQCSKLFSSDVFLETTIKLS